MSTVHNPSQFKPQDYEVWAYLDNSPNSGAIVTLWTPEMRALWEAEMVDALGKDWRRVAFKCTHCGNGTVRYIAACLHIPTGEKVVFGSSCVHRLGFKDEKQFQLAQIQARAEAQRVKLAAYLAREKFLADRPELVAAITASEGIENTFVSDIKNKLNNYGELSDAQVAAFVKAVNRAIEHKNNPVVYPPAGPAPVGKAMVRGKIISRKEKESQYGVVEKICVVLENGSKVWGTLPNNLYATGRVGTMIEFSATFEPKAGDATFAFFKRPSKASTLSTGELPLGVSADSLQCSGE